MPETIQTAFDFLAAHRLINNTYAEWLTAFATMVAIMAVVWLVKRLAAHKLRRVAATTSTKWDDLLVELVEDVRFWLTLIVALGIASYGLTFGPVTMKVLQIATVSAVGLQLLLSSRLVVDFGLARLIERSRTQHGEPDPTLRTSMVVLRFVIMLVLGVIVLLLALENLGVQVGPMLTGLGIGGIAVALAVQRVLGDLLASISILLDKPFVVGDAIQVGTQSGTVETIGIKTTRVRATSGEQLIFGNSDLLAARIQNFKRMEERRVAFTIGVVYDCPPEKLRQIPQIVQQIVEAQDQVRFDRCHIFKLGSYSIDAEIVFFVRSSDYRLFMDVQQAILLAIIERFAAEKIEFAYPTQVAIEKKSA
jgi:small-conductance mechanosensitive channel